MHRSAMAVTAVLVSCLAAPISAGDGPRGPGHGRPSCLAPTGGDDTAALQAALDRCSHARGPCAVTLCAGTFETGILRVEGFRGTLSGEGARATVLRARPELAVNDNPDGYYYDDPFSPARDPWPYLLQFIGGKGRVRDLALEVPSPPTVAPPDGPLRPTTGWFFFGGEIFELAGALLVTGPERADFEIEGVRIGAGPDSASALGTTLIAGVSFEGLLFNPGDPGPYPVLPLGGRFEVEESSFTGMNRAVSLGELASAEVAAARNRFRSPFAVNAVDISRTRLVVEANLLEGALGGVQVFQNLDGAPSGEAVVLVHGNEGRVAAGGHGVLFLDVADPALERATWLSVSENRLTVGDASGPAASAVTATGAGHLGVRANRFVGRAAVGVDIDRTVGCRVVNNALSALATDPGPDVRLGPQTSDCLAIVGARDTVVDEGSGNRVIRR